MSIDDATRIAEIVPQLTAPHIGAANAYLCDLNRAAKPMRPTHYRESYGDAVAITALATINTPIVPLFIAQRNVASYIARNREERYNAIIAAFCDLGLVYPSNVSNDALANVVIVMAVHLPPTPFCAISVWPDREFIAIRNGQFHHGQTIYLNGDGRRVE